MRIESDRFSRFEPQLLLFFQILEKNPNQALSGAKNPKFSTSSKFVSQFL